MNKPRIEFIVTTLRNIGNLQSTNQQAYNKINRAFSVKITPIAVAIVATAVLRASVI